MQFGICTSKPAEWRIAAGLGYDFVEGQFSALVSASQSDFDAMLKAQQTGGIPVASFNCFFPGSFQLYAYDPETGRESPAFADISARLHEYLEIGFSRAARLGGKAVVIGSSGARSIPADLPRALAEEQFARHLHQIAQTAKRHGMVVTVEPLNPKETNFINTLADSLDMVGQSEDENLQVMIDFFHAHVQGEPYEANLRRAGAHLAHVHLCRTDRALPKEGDGVGQLVPFFRALHEIGYDSRVSLEGNLWGDFERCACVGLAELKTSEALTRNERK